MKKALLIILAVAILGLLGLFSNKSAPTTAGLVNNPPTNQPSSLTSNVAPVASYKDGTYIGASTDTPYGTVQVAAVISGGKITDVNFLQMPHDRGHTQEVTTVSKPLLLQTTLQKQDAKDIDFVSGATSTCYAYQESLQAALDKASGVSLGQSITS